MAVLQSGQRGVVALSRDLRDLTSSGAFYPSDLSQIIESFGRVLHARGPKDNANVCPAAAVKPTGGARSKPKSLVCARVILLDPVVVQLQSYISP